MALESFLTNNLSPALAQEAEEFLDSQDTAHPFQFPQWADPASRLVLLRDSGRIRWLATFNVYAPLGRKMPWIRVAMANRGPVCDDLKLWGAATDELAKNLRRERVAYLEVSPEWIQQTTERDQSFLQNSEWRSVDIQRATLRLDLSGSADEIFANFTKTTRYEIRRAERLGAAVSLATSATEIEEFTRLYQSVAARKGFAADSSELLQREIRWLIHAESRGALLLARTDDVVRGGAVIARAGRRCWYIWGASGKDKDKEQNANVGHLLQWNALQWAKAHGCTEYDFGGYTPGATSGPAWFKAGFGGTEVRFVPPHRRVIRPMRYRLYSLLSQDRIKGTG